MTKRSDLSSCCSTMIPVGRLRYRPRNAERIAVPLVVISHSTEPSGRDCCIDRGMLAGLSPDPTHAASITSLNWTAVGAWTRTKAAASTAKTNPNIQPPHSNLLTTKQDDGIDQ